MGNTGTGTGIQQQKVVEMWSAFSKIMRCSYGDLLQKSGGHSCMDHFGPSLSGKCRVFLGRLQVGQRAFAITAAEWTGKSKTTVSTV